MFVGYAITLLNLFCSLGGNLCCTELDADSESGLQIDLGGRTSEHKQNFQFEVPMKRYYIFRAVCKSVLIVLTFAKNLPSVLWTKCAVIRRQNGVSCCKLPLDKQTVLITQYRQFSFQQLTFLLW